MKSRALTFALLLAVLVGVAAPAWAGYLSRSDVKRQNEIFQRWWGDDFQWKFDELPLKGKVEKHRMPYAGYIYPDKAGGCANVLRKYDRAFNWGRGSAASHERRDIEIHKDEVRRPGGLFGWRMVTRRDTPDWAGHCNGWVCAAIRHAEPQKTVYRNGVAFTPADIKGLLAEMYVYNDTISLDSEGGDLVDAASLHAILANWLGRGNHPIGADITPGKEVWNYPIYGFSSAAAKRGPRRVEVRTNVGYVYMLNQEYHRAPKNNRYKSFHYILYLDDEGRIVGGDYMADSDRLDMLWVPRRLFRAGSEGNRNGNPYVDTETVLAMWRESASEEIRRKWWNIDPTEEDRIIVEQEENGIEPPVIEEELAAEPHEGEAAEETSGQLGEAAEAVELEPAEEAPTDVTAEEETIDLPGSDEDATDAAAAETDDEDTPGVARVLRNGRDLIRGVLRNWRR